MSVSTLPSLRTPLAAAALALVASLSACGGGGGGDGDGNGNGITDDPAPPMPSIVTFGIGTKDDARLTFSASIESVPVTISYPLLGFNGSWNRTTQSYTLNGATGVASAPSPPLFGSFANQIVETLAWTGDNEPTTGKIENSTPAGNAFFLPQAVQSTIIGGGLTLTYPGEVPLAVDRDTYLNLWTDDARPEWWRLASFGGASLGLALDRIRLILDLMAFVNGNDLAISGAGAAGLETACSPRPGAATGSRRIALADPDGELNPGDDLVVTYTNCWIDDPADDVDVLLNGTIRLNGYIENASPVSTGFDEFRFDALAEQETGTNGGVVTVDPIVVTTTGTLTLFVTP